MSKAEYEADVIEYENSYHDIMVPINTHHDVMRMRREYPELYKVYKNEMHSGAEAREISFESDGNTIAGRMFHKKGCQGNAPCIIYIHGGGFVAGDLTVVDGMASELAVDLGARVITFNYRLAPEACFPAALVDTVAVIEQVFNRCKELGVDSSRVILSGESCGGNISIAAPMVLRAKGGPTLCGIAPINPIFDVHRWARREVMDVSQSYADELYEYTSNYLGPHFTWIDDTGASPLRSQALGKMPPAFVWACRSDPLHLEALQLSERLVQEGNVAECFIDEYATHGSLRARHHYNFAKDAFETVSNGMAKLLKATRASCEVTS